MHKQKIHILLLIVMCLNNVVFAMDRSASTNAGMSAEKEKVKDDNIQPKLGVSTPQHDVSDDRYRTLEEQKQDKRLCTQRICQFLCIITALGAICTGFAFLVKSEPECLKGTGVSYWYVQGTCGDCTGRLTTTMCSMWHEDLPKFTNEYLSRTGLCGDTPPTICIKRESKYSQAKPTSYRCTYDLGQALFDQSGSCIPKNSSNQTQSNYALNNKLQKMKSRYKKNYR